MPIYEIKNNIGLKNETCDQCKNNNFSNLSLMFS